MARDGEVREERGLRVTGVPRGWWQSVRSIQQGEFQYPFAAYIGTLPREVFKDYIDK